jgi:flagellar L-ring protein precursor FlgH
MVSVRLATIAVLGFVCAAAPLEAQAPTAARAPRRSWTADRHEFEVGDVITVLIDEFTNAAANKGNSASDQRQRDLSLGAGGSTTTPLPSISGNVSSRNDAHSAQTGQATQANRFQGEMTVRVTEIDPSGLLRVEGLKVVDVDGSRQEMTLAGWVRAQDVSARNMIDSWRVGDVELAYSSKGNLGKTKGGVIGKILGGLWP